jgi:hypothetical protein
MQQHHDDARSYIELYIYRALAAAGPNMINQRHMISDEHFN